MADASMSHLNSGRRTAIDGGRDAMPPGPAAGAKAVDPAVIDSLRHCQHVTRTRARNLYYGLMLAPEPRRSAACCIYAFRCACDDLADGPAIGDTAPARLAQLRRDTHQAVQPSSAGVPLPPGMLWPALRYVVETYRIDPARLRSVIDGQRRDLMGHPCATFDDLYTYCSQVGASVGLACLNIWGHDGDPGVPQLAEYRGVAFQLTNILRDLLEDARRGRIYLPREDLDRFGCTVSQIRTGDADANFDRLMVFQIERARSYYQMSESLERHLDPPCRPSSWAMMQIYRELLERIAQSPRRVLTSRIELGPMRKLRIAARAMWKQRWA